ncbi:phosphoglycerate kinase [Candidatus Azambacteria bacterium RIFCSPHIGHO2_02_46_12]|uniref:Phosphoglycerate kinase n=1 Tax=Candidatus Azambacteria bacterium RIFCSPHIGHO2_02_46_12 TaxID=1797295 RepID=A0A1F5BHV4_9BACT|nr:MAG: phosphoglycerate kinase [Candidatus Azambacteria bacterium RIFCSPHIGHO2_02_46_12]
MLTIKSADVKNKKVLLRVDFNVVLVKKGGTTRIADDFRIRAALPTIKHLLKNKAKIIIASHLGDGKESLRPVSRRLEKLLKKKVRFVGECAGKQVEEKVRAMKNGQILFLENLRRHPEEKKNDLEFAEKLARLAQIYVNDAFGVCHRPHASVVGITKFLPSYAGLLLEKETNVLEQATTSPDRPLAVIVGGAKISTKIKLIERFLNLADDVILGGALANTVLKAKGLNIGKSLVEEEMIKPLKKIEITSPKLHLPVDVIVSSSESGERPVRVCGVGGVKNGEKIFDIGPDSLVLFDKIIHNAKTIIWNGPIGLFEVEQFARGSYFIAQSVAASSAYSIVGGGETIAVLGKLNLTDKFNHVSTGGGALLEFLSGNKLPGLESLGYYTNN